MVDDVPAVAVTLNTNDFGDVETLAILAQLAPAKAAMTASGTSVNANLVSGGTYLHGVCLADFAVTCGNLPGVTLWAPVQAECDMGTLADNIDQTLFLDEVYVNSIEFGYTTGANATENFGAETDNKMWLLNGGAYVNWETPAVTNAMATFTVGDGVTIPVLSTGNVAFLRKTTAGIPAITVYIASTNTMVNYALWDINASDWAGNKSVTCFGYDSTALTGSLVGPYTITVPTGLVLTTSDRLEVVYAANGYVDAMNTYFVPKTDGANADVGALRQGQVEVSIVDGSTESAAWRLTGCTISADLTRTPLAQLGNLGPYDRPLTVPIPITVTVDSTAGDLENWAKFAGKITDYNGATLDDIDLNDLMNKDDLMLVVKVFEQTDEEAGGNGEGRKVNTDSLVGEVPFVNGALGTAYALTNREYALKTILVKNLKITNEGMTLDMGANATQTFGFRSTNDLYVIKGDIDNAALYAGIARNAS